MAKPLSISAFVLLSLLSLCMIAPTFALAGDVNGDGKVNGLDLGLVAYSFGSYGPNFLYPGSPASARWNPSADLNNNGRVDGVDLGIVASHLG